MRRLGLADHRRSEEVNESQEIRVLDWEEIDFKTGAGELADDEEGRKPGGSWRGRPPRRRRAFGRSRDRARRRSGIAVVLVSADGSARVLRPDLAAH